jgi:hypothetical protein
MTWLAQHDFADNLLKLLKETFEAGGDRLLPGERRGALPDARHHHRRDSIPRTVPRGPEHRGPLCPPRLLRSREP